jgi:predicted transglutaminase-like cysteine proteinase
MNKILKSLIVAAGIMAFAGQFDAEAGFIGAPRPLGAVTQYLKFRSPTLPPIAFTEFCLRYSHECKPSHIVFRGGRLKLTPARWAEIRAVNGEVNAGIRPEPNLKGLAGEEWLLHPRSGDCNDYAVTKRHDLIARGWPARAVLLSEVVTRSGEHHLVVVVRARSGDLVLDNLTTSIRPWSLTPYRWVRIQTAENPLYWAALSQETV